MTYAPAFSDLRSYMVWTVLLSIKKKKLLSFKYDVNVMSFCYFQMEVTFNFLEIRAMNTYPEHQVTAFVPAFWSLTAV